MPPVVIFKGATSFSRDDPILQLRSLCPSKAHGAELPKRSHSLRPLLAIHHMKSFAFLEQTAFDPTGNCITAPKN